MAGNDKPDKSPIPRRTLFDDIEPYRDKNIYCRMVDLSNEASVEEFFISRLIKDLGFKDSQIKPKTSIETLTVSAGGRKTEKYKPDYVLFINGQPRCVIDAKATTESLKKWIPQCSGYSLALNRKYKSNPVKYFVLSNGLKTLVFEWDKEDPVLSLDFADFHWGNPKYEQLKNLIDAKSIVSSSVGPTLASSGDFTLIRPTSEKARQLFAQCHKAIWKAEICSPSPAFMAFVKVMFIKLWADKRLRFDVASQEMFKGEKKEIKVPSTSVVFSVDWIESREKDGVKNPLDVILFERLREDIEQEIQEKKKKRIFNKDERIGLRADTIKDVVRRLQHYDMFGIDEDLNGRLFETFLSATMRGRELGQFFTPRSVVHMMTSLAMLKADRNHQDRVIDACCGSGGFLIEALTVMRNQVRFNQSISDGEKSELIDTISNNCLYGIDAGKDPPLARIARINMYLHGDGGSRIYYADSLDKVLEIPDQVDPEDSQNIKELRNMFHEGESFDYALTNPPFSMTKEAKSDTERKILEQYQIARKTDGGTLRPSLRSSVMFVERYYDLLKPGGVLITVIDDTILASGDFDWFRDYVRSRFLIRGIISLPGNAFRRAGSRVKTSVLILEKKKKQKDVQPSCFAFFSEHLGVDDLTPRATDADVLEARTKAENETLEITNGYAAFLGGKKGPLVLSPDRLVDRLDLKYCVPNFGRMKETWEKEGIEVKELKECVAVVEDIVNPSASPEQEFTLIKVSYDGKCEVEKQRKGKAIKPKKMLRVKEGQLVFSTIRSTDGAIGIVPPDMDGALVAKTSYVVFEGDTKEDTAYLWGVLRSHEIRADMQSLSPGSNRYTTRWPDVGIVPVPWLEEGKRMAIGKELIETWEMERKLKQAKRKAMHSIEELGVESEDSIQRFNESKAPT